MTVLRFVPRGTGFAWLFSVFSSLAAWVLFLVSKNNLPFLFSGNYFVDIASDTKFPSFQIDLIIWPIILSVLAVVMGTIISSADRVGFTANIVEWASVFILGAIGFAICASQNVLTAVVFLTLFDFIEFFIILTSKKQEKGNYLFLFWRLISLLIFMGVFSWSSLDENSSNDWETLQSIPAQLALIACIIRMGISPSKSLTGIPGDINNGIDTSRHLIGFIISAAIVIQLPAFTGGAIVLSGLLIYLLISMAISLIRLRTENSACAVNFWQSTVGAVICAEYLYGYSAAAIMFVTAFIPILFILRFPFRSGRFYFVTGLFAILNFSGIPFTTNSSGLNGFNTRGAVPGALFIVALIPMFYLTIKFVLSNKYPDSNVERWALTIAPIGSLLLVISSWLVFILWQPDAVKFSISIQAILMTLGGTAIYLAEKFKLFNNQPEMILFNKITSNYSNQFIRLFRSDKITSISILEKSYAFIINLFESDGGILWAILCLVLIITIISGIGLN